MMHALSGTRYFLEVFSRYNYYLFPLICADVADIGELGVPFFPPILGD
jgi:hypothetical protein